MATDFHDCTQLGQCAIAAGLRAERGRCLATADLAYKLLHATVHASGLERHPGVVPVFAAACSVYPAEATAVLRARADAGDVGAAETLLRLESAAVCRLVLLDTNATLLLRTPPDNLPITAALRLAVADFVRAIRALRDICFRIRDRHSPLPTASDLFPEPETRGTKRAAPATTAQPRKRATQSPAADLAAPEKEQGA
jgi:hypothetical protein